MFMLPALTRASLVLPSFIGEMLLLENLIAEAADGRGVRTEASIPVC